MPSNKIKVGWRVTVSPAHAIHLAGTWETTSNYKHGTSVIKIRDIDKVIMEPGVAEVLILGIEK